MKLRLLALTLFAAPAFAQGPLGPGTLVDPKIGLTAPLDGSGNPQPTMKTLHQVEPRVPLINGAPGVTVSAGGNITIAQSGNYYLTQNVTVTSGSGITISVLSNTVAGITIDLNGFSITSTAATAQGAGVSAATGTQSSISISNGHIGGSGRLSAAGVFSGGGFEYGVDLYSPYHNTVTNIHVTGVSANAIRLDPEASSAIQDCTARHCFSGLLGANVTNCVSTYITNTAIQARTVTNSVGRSLIGSGISADLVLGSFGTTGATTGSTGGIVAIVGSVINSRAISGGGSSDAIITNIVNGCSASGTINANYKYNTP
jgi:hypothetical protein